LKKLKEIERQLGWNPESISTPTSSTKLLSSPSTSLTSSITSRNNISNELTQEFCGEVEDENSATTTSSSSDEIHLRRAGVRATGVFASKMKQDKNSFINKSSPLSRFPSPRLEKQSSLNLDKDKIDVKNNNEQTNEIIKDKEINEDEDKKTLSIELHSASTSTSNHTASKGRRKSVCPVVADLDLSDDYGSELSALSDLSVDTENTNIPSTTTPTTTSTTVIPTKKSISLMNGNTIMGMNSFKENMLLKNSNKLMATSTMKDNNQLKEVKKMPLSPNQAMNSN